MKSTFDAKRYVQLFMAGYVPKSKDEKKFVDKHVAQLHQDVNGNKDDVFKATNVPTHKREPYHGYEKGADERMYESVDQLDEESLVAGTRIVSKHEGDDGHRAEVRYNKDWEEYQVHHYLDGKHMGEGPVSYHGRDKKDAESTARYTTTTRNSDYTRDREPKTKSYGVDSASNVKEETQLDEVSKKEHEYNMDAAQREMDRRESEGEDMTGAKIHPKTYEIIKPKKALKEEMSDAQMAKRERIVKSMKKKAGTFEKRYGEKAEDVMYATATKMAMEDLDYVNLEMTDLVLKELMIEEASLDLDKEKLKSLKGMEAQAKKIRDVAKKYPIAIKESAIEQILSQLDEDDITIKFNNGEEAYLDKDIAESILNIFMDLTEENQQDFEAILSESIEDFEGALAFITEANEGAE